MQYDLHHDDFQQGEALAGLPREKPVQKWTADRLRLKQRCSYSVEREVHVADENEPDIRLRAKVADPSVLALTDDSQIGASLRVCADEKDRADFDQCR